MRGSLRSLWQLEGTHTSCHNSRNTLRFPLPRELRPDSPAITPEHSCAPLRISNGDLTSLRQHERLPEFPVVPGEESQASRCNSRKARRFPRQCEMRLFSPTAPRGQPRDLSPNASGGLTPFSPPIELQEIPVANREQSGVRCFHSR